MNLEIIFSIVAVVISSVAVFFSYLIYKTNAKSVSYLTKPDISMKIRPLPYFSLTVLSDDKYEMRTRNEISIHNIGKGYAKDVNVKLLVKLKDYLKENKKKNGFDYKITSNHICRDIIKVTSSLTETKSLSFDRFNKTYHILYEMKIPVLSPKKSFSIFQNLDFIQEKRLKFFFQNIVKNIPVGKEISYFKNAILSINYQMFDKSSRTDYYKMNFLYTYTSEKDISFFISSYNRFSPPILLNPYRPSRKYRPK